MIWGEYKIPGRIRRRVHAGTSPASVLEDLRTKDSWVPRANGGSTRNQRLKEEKRVEERKVDEKRRGEVQGCLPSKTEGAPLAYEVWSRKMLPQLLEPPWSSDRSHSRSAFHSSFLLFVSLRFSSLPLAHLVRTQRELRCYLCTYLIPGYPISVRRITNQAKGNSLKTRLLQSRKLILLIESRILRWVLEHGFDALNWIL